MMREIKFDPKEIINETEQFINSFKSVILGTVSKNGEVDVTYAPHLKIDGEHYIYISEIGDHYTNLTENEQKFEIMFLEEEKEAMSAIARKRARFNVTAEFLPRDEKFEKIMDKFQESVGETFKIVRQMKDFHLVKLNVIDGRYVKGFGQAYILKDGTATQMTVDKNGKGHRQ
ncbi:pyridoxamine 5'-phosphate oxidase family protein [Fusobacterium sp.]|uniref:pyridoxamine 5'-phosphate oxidase family protein n=1 Tax=Fusobacterium sp. TaxID=68766 RepID=UPI00262BAB3D|nr:pyridoxamine 5'-phosphate oxidase family protein [Fusobacterium sp.]